MKVLLLSPYAEKLIPSMGKDIIRPVEGLDHIDWTWPDIVVSFGYRKIIKKDILSSLPRPPINIHISLLPYNRGSDPNFWSWFDNTPKGVTIHQIDENIDTGDVLAQIEIVSNSYGTLRSTYDDLQGAAESLFRRYWPLIRDNGVSPTPQRGKVTYHRHADTVPWLEKLSNGWDTPVQEVMEMGKRHREEKAA